MKYAIYPPIGFARVGNSPTGYFIAPEKTGAPGTEVLTDGSEVPVTTFKDANYRMKRQAARFHIFEIDDNGVASPASFPDGAHIQWTVSVANKKDAVKRSSPPGLASHKIEVDPARTNRIISATASVQGAGASPVKLTGTYATTTPVTLADIHTDSQHRLIVLGGSGRSESPTNAKLGGGEDPGRRDFYRNPDWFDDVCDGSISATIVLPGAAPIQASPAWVVVGPPDFAPSIKGIVTLYDKLIDVAKAEEWMALPQRPSFNAHIRPIIERAANLKWVNRKVAGDTADNSSNWHLISTDWATLANPAPVAAALRMQTRDMIESLTDGSGLYRFALCDWQAEYLAAWADGHFEPGDDGGRSHHEELTFAALDATVGQGFFPGIEAGRKLTYAPLYFTDPFEFRLNPAKLQPGDITAYMALPWQADFMECNTAWWPSQRPDYVPDGASGLRKWTPPDLDESTDHRAFLGTVMRLGVVHPSAAGLVEEQGRDPEVPKGTVPPWS